jgi:hypothetical protein
LKAGVERHDATLGETAVLLGKWADIVKSCHSRLSFLIFCFICCAIHARTFIHRLAQIILAARAHQLAAFAAQPVFTPSADLRILGVHVERVCAVDARDELRLTAD